MPRDSRDADNPSGNFVSPVSKTMPSHVHLSEKDREDYVDRTLSRVPPSTLIKKG